jgi:hypothetical protein
MSEPEPGAASTTSTPRARPGDQPVASREVALERRRARRELGDERAARRDRVREVAVRGRIHAVGPGAGDRDRRGARVERAAVRGGVDALRKPRDDREARVGERARERLRVLDALRRALPAADDRERRRVEELEAPERVERRRRIGELEQRPRVVGVVPREQPVARLGEPGGRGVVERAIARREPRGGFAPGHALDARARRLEHALGRAERAQERDERRRGEAGGRERRPRGGARRVGHRCGFAPRGKRQGRRTASPTTTGSVVLSRMA